MLFLVVFSLFCLSYPLFSSPVLAPTISTSALASDQQCSSSDAVRQQREVSERISSLVTEFQTLIDSVEQSLTGRGVTVAEILPKIKHIPLTLHEQLGDCFSTRIPEILQVTSVQHLFITLSRLWDYLNPGLLEFLVREFGSDSDKELTRVYLERLKKFRNQVTIGEYINASHGDVSSHSHFYYTKMITKFGSEWENKTLQEAEDFKIEACSNCNFLCSFLARMDIRRSSIAIVFYFPHPIDVNVNQLEELLRKKKAEHCQISVDGTCVYDMTGQVRIVRRLKSRREGEWSSGGSRI